MNEIEKAQQQSREALLAASRVISEASKAMNKAFKDVRFASEELEAQLSALSKVEKEYRAGEWVSALRESYFVIDGVGDVGQVINCNDDEDKEYQARGNAFPTESIAKAAKAHADWWREFDMIADAPLQYTNDKGMYEVHRAGIFSSWAITFRPPEIIIHPQEIVRLGGEQKVIEMMKKGRVFRFKWGGE